MTALAAEVERLAELVHDIGDAVAALTLETGENRARIKALATGAETMPRPWQIELLTPRQWRWLAQAIDDATQYRSARRSPHCRDCERHPDGACAACAADFELQDAYHELAAQLGAVVPVPAGFGPRRLRPVGPGEKS